LRENVIASLVLTNPEKWRGEYLKKSIKVSKNNNGTSFTGFQALPSQAVNTRQYLVFYPKFYQIDVTLPFTEMAVNLTDDDRILDLAEAEMTSSGQDMADSVGDILYSDGTGNGGLDFDGLGNMVDDGTNAATYGGQSRTTYPVLDSVVTDASGTLSLAKMATQYNGQSDGTIVPTIGLADRNTYSLYEQLIEPKNRIYITVNEIETRKKGLVGTAGFVGLEYKGFTITPDRKVPLDSDGAGQLLFLNEKFIHFTALERFPEAQPVQYKDAQFEGNDYNKNTIKGMGFHWTGWVKPVNQMAFVGRIILAGQFWTDAPRRQSRLYNISNV